MIDSKLFIELHYPYNASKIIFHRYLTFIPRIWRIQAAPLLTTWTLIAKELCTKLLFGFTLSSWNCSHVLYWQLLVFGWSERCTMRINTRRTWGTIALVQQPRKWWKDSTRLTSEPTEQRKCYWQYFFCFSWQNCHKVFWVWWADYLVGVSSSAATICSES